MSSQRPLLATIGELTLDDVVDEGRGADWKQPGGGGLYSAVGAHVWSEDVALSSVVGADYPAALLDSLAREGLITSAVTISPDVLSIGLWLLYERDGARRQLEKRRGGTFAEVDAHRTSLYDHGLVPVGVHIAPQSSQGQLLALEHLRGRTLVRTLDVLIEPGIDRVPYLAGEMYRELDAFLPSEQEVRDLWGHDDVRRLGRWLSERGSTATVVVKRGRAGVHVLTEGRVVLVPTVVDDLVDPTGAGDAFCGGFLAGLTDTGDSLEAAVRGCVSASFVCETRGAIEAMQHVRPEVAERRATRARALMKEVT